MNRIVRILGCLIVLFSLTACATRGVDATRFGLEDAVIAADLETFPQDLTVYAGRAGKDTALMAPERQGGEDTRFDENFFAAWDRTVLHLPRDDVFEAVRKMSPARGFAENLRPWGKERWQEVVANCFMEGYGGISVRPAITVGTANLRRMPTDAPYFLNPGKAGEGFPFDYLQNSVLWVGTPVAVIHISRDRMWAYVQTRLISGWTRVANLAVVDKDFIDTWRSRPLAVLIQDNVALIVTDQKTDAVTGGEPAALGYVGTVLPLAPIKNRREPKSPHVFVHVPLRSSDGRAIVATALAPMSATRKKPMYLTPLNVALVGNAMMGQPYGWSGFFGQRDCSATMHDLFVPFGVWLPRNSRLQGELGTHLDLGGLTPDQKEEKIIREGIPFFSLVSMPGHVGLYLGTYPKPEGRETRDVPVMFHNIWGLRVVGGSGENKREGRAIIGKAVVTSLRPGVEHEGLSSPAGILDRISGLAVLPDPLPGE